MACIIMMSRKRRKLKNIFEGRPPNESDRQRGARQLRRLETLVDGVFALVIVLTVFELPLPVDEGLTAVSVSEFLRTHVVTFLPVLIAIVLVVIYWIQNNILFGNLSRTDDRHTTIFILQIFFLLLYFYTIGLGLDLDNPPGALALQSAAVTLVGLTALAGWSYASRNHRLLTLEINDEEIRNVRIRMMAEPTTALVTLACAPLGQTFWEVAWLSYPIIAWLLRKKTGGKPTEKNIPTDENVPL